MSPDNKHTKPFAGGDAAPSEEQLLAYLEGRLSAEEANAVERLMEADLAGADALEGLQGLDGEQTRRMRSKINAKLSSKLAAGRRKRRGLPDQRWTWTAVALVLLLVVAAFLVMHYLKK